MHTGTTGDRPSLASAVRTATGLNVARCYQCGKCSAGCPMAPETTLRPHDIMRLVQRDARERLFADDAPWLCLTCETCSARCPNGVDPARVIDALREIARREAPGSGPRAVGAFHAAFLGQIKSHGRVHEVGLVAAYKLRSGALFADVATAPGLLTRGKLPLRPARVADPGEIRRLFAACGVGDAK